MTSHSSMTQPTMISEKDAILRERRAWIAGLRGSTYQPSLTSKRENELAAQMFPLPKLTRPRVVRDADGNEWCFRDSRDTALLMCKPARFGDWINDSHPDYPSMTRERLALMVELIKHPTEEIEDDA